MKFPLAYREDTPPVETGGGQPPADWRASLPESYDGKDDKGAVAKIPLRADPTLGKYKSVEDLARGHIEATKMVGRGLAVPPADAKPEERRAFFDKLGVPKDAAGYADIKAPEGIAPEGLTAYLTNVALSEGLTPRQVQASVNFLAEHQALLLRDTIQKWDDSQEGLRKEWGMNFDRNHDISARFLSESFKKAGVGEEFTSLLDRMGLGHHPDFIKWTHMLAKHATEDVFEPGAPDIESTNDARDAQIKTMFIELSRLNPGTSEYSAAREKYEALLKARFGSEEVAGGNARR